MINSIYNMEWPVLNNSDKKALLIIMRRATIPIEFSSAYIITMNLDSFVAVSISINTYGDNNRLLQAFQITLIVYDFCSCLSCHTQLSICCVKPMSSDV